MIKSVLILVLNAACYMIVARALISWFVPSMGGAFHQVYKVLEELTDPILAPFVIIFKGFAQRTGLDLSPLFAILLLQYLGSLVANL